MITGKSTRTLNGIYKHMTRTAATIAVLAITCLLYVPSISAQSQQQFVTVRVIVERVVGLDNIDPGSKGPPDFFAKISINSEQHTTGVVEDSNEIAPYWEYARRIDRSQQSTIPVKIELFDEDGPFDGNDHIDINPSSGRDLNLAVDLNPCIIHGDINDVCDSSLTVSGNEQDKASIQIRIEVKITAVTVIIDRVTGLDPDEIEDEIFSGDPDFYTRITINDQAPFTSGEIEEANDIHPNWVHSAPIDIASHSFVQVVIEIWDDDDPLSPDHIDVSSDPNGRNITLTIDVSTCQISGDVSGNGCSVTFSSAGGSTNRATIQFRIEISKEPPITQPVDLVASGLEVTQAIQDLNNSVRLVEGKRTFVRFHVFSINGEHITTARLNVSRQEPPMGDVWLDPIDTGFGTNLRVLTAPNRRVREHSFLFELPTQYTTGNVVLTAVLNPITPNRGPSPEEVNYDNNSILSTIVFETVPSIDLYVYRVGYGPAATPDYPPEFHLDRLESWLGRAYPISRLQVWRRTLYYGTDVPSCDDVNSRLVSKGIWDVLFGWLGSVSGPRHYGMLTALEENRGCSDGIPGRAASGFAFPSAGYWWDTDGSMGDWFGGHELGHAYERYHAEFCGAEGGRDYPYDGGRISSTYTGNNALYGFDVDTREIYDPSWRDMMTYCHLESLPLWISDFNYEGLMTYFQENDLAAADRRLVEQTKRILLVGVIDLNTNGVGLQPVFIIPEAGDIEPRTPGAYDIVLRNTLGEEQARYPFTPSEVTDVPRLASFSELVPYVDGTATIEIWQANTRLFSMKVSASAPAIRLLSPNGGEVLSDGPVTVTWTASDPDDDQLTFNVQFSADNGQTWEMVALNVTGESAQIDARSIRAGTQSLFRVWASDGIHTISDASDTPFVVPNRLPTATIITPLDGAILTTNQTLFLGGDAYDIDIGPLPNEQLQWLSSIDGLLATGEQASVTGLSVGIHTITFRVDDGQGGVATDTVLITVVGDPSQLPPIANGLVVGPGTIVLDPDREIKESPLYIDNMNLGNSIQWNASSDQPWLVLSKTAGVTPDALVATFTGFNLPAGDYSATITVTSQDVPGDRVEITVTAVRQADLAIVKIATPNPAIAGSVLDYRIDLNNMGPAPAASVTLVDQLASDLTINTVSPAENCGYEANKVTCVFPAVPNGESRTVVVNTRVAPSVADGLIITNTAVVTHAGNEHTLNNNLATVSTNVIRRADLSLQQIDRPDPVAAGSILTYDLHVTNRGPSLASGAMVSATLPPGFVYQAEASSRMCSEAKGIVTCSLGEITPTIEIIVPVVVSVDPTIEVRKVLTSTSSVTASEIDPVAENNHAFIETTVTRASGLMVSQTRQPETVFAGGSIAYTIDVRNMGASIATGVVLTDLLPLDIRFDAAGTTLGCMIQAQEISCDLGTLANGSNRSVTIAGHVSPTVTAGTTLTNVVGVRSNEADANLNDNTATDTTIVYSRIHLPVISNQTPLNLPGEVDLIVKTITLTSDILEVTIQNTGTGPVLPGSYFWVDLYINSPYTPTAVNQTWQVLQAEGGIVWGIVGAGVRLNPGDELTLRMNDRFYFGEESRIPSVVQPGTIFAQVDSANLATNFGGVLEGHEIRSEHYNNINSITLIEPVKTERWDIAETSDGDKGETHEWLRGSLLRE